jgi:hypothetical protein
VIVAIAMTVDDRDDRDHRWCIDAPVEVTGVKTFDDAEGFAAWITTTTSSSVWRVMHIKDAAP